MWILLSKGRTQYCLWLCYGLANLLVARSCLLWLWGMTSRPLTPKLLSFKFHEGGALKLEVSLYRFLSNYVRGLEKSRGKGMKSDMISQKNTECWWSFTPSGVTLHLLYHQGNKLSRMMCNRKWRRLNICVSETQCSDGTVAHDSQWADPSVSCHHLFECIVKPLSSQTFKQIF